MFRHLKETNQTYGSHFAFGFTAGIKMIYGGIISIVHGLVPDLFPFKADNIAKELVAQSFLRTSPRPSNGNQISKE